MNRIKRIALSIVTHNSKDLFETLDNLLLVNTPLDIYIYDNSSSKEYCDQLKKYLDRVTAIEFSEKNSGFGYGHNKNLEKVNSEFFIVCNPDILVSKESIQLLQEYAASNENASMVAPKVLNSDGSTQYLIRNHLNVFDYSLRFLPFKSIKKLFNKRLAKFECRDLADKTQEIRFGSGCFMFLRTKDIKEVQGFDERFFMYFEDNDLCQKLRQNKKSIIYLPAATVTHFYAKEAHKNKKLFLIFLQSMVKYFNKWGWNLF